VAVKIKLKRMGKIHAPYYRIIVADGRTKRDGRAIEEIGKYHPKHEPSFIEVDSERAQHWLSVGAQPTDPVRKILEITGDWQKFKGLPGTEGTLRPQPEKVDRRALYEAAMASVGGDDANTATTPRRKRTAPATEATAAAQSAPNAQSAPAETPAETAAASESPDAS